MTDTDRCEPPPEWRLMPYECVPPQVVEALEALVMACELPGDHCEVARALPTARAALALYRGEAGR